MKHEIASLKSFDKQQQLFNSAKPAVHDKAVATLKKLIDEQPNSEAAQRARELLHVP